MCNVNPLNIELGDTVHSIKHKVGIVTLIDKNFGGLNIKPISYKYTGSLDGIIEDIPIRSVTLISKSNLNNDLQLTLPFIDNDMTAFRSMLNDKAETLDAIIAKNNIPISRVHSKKEIRDKLTMLRNLSIEDRQKLQDTLKNSHE